MSGPLNMDHLRTPQHRPFEQKAVDDFTSIEKNAKADPTVDPSELTPPSIPTGTQDDSISRKSEQ